MSKTEQKASLQAEINRLKEKIVAKEASIAEKNTLRTSFLLMKEAKKKGNVLLAIGLLLIPAEVLACLFHSPFEAKDLVIIGIFLIPGILRKINGMKEYKEHRNKLSGMDMDLIQKDLTALESETKELKAQLKAKKADLRKISSYGGRYWDYKNLNNFDSQTMDQLERDFIDVLELIETGNNGNFLVENWLSIAIVQYTGASASNDTATIAKFDAVGTKLRATERWPLAFLDVLIQAATINILNEVWNAGKPFPLDDAMESANLTVPDDQAGLYVIGLMGMDEIVSRLVIEMKKY